MYLFIITGVILNIAEWMSTLSWTVCNNALGGNRFFYSKLITSERVKNGKQKFCKVVRMSVEIKFPVLVGEENSLYERLVAHS